MQQLAIIKQIFPIVDRQYTNQQVQPAVFTSQGFLLTDGINTFFAETTGNYAKAALGLKLEVGMTVNVQLVVDARKWQTQQGEDRYENRVTITNIARWE